MNWQWKRNNKLVAQVFFIRIPVVPPSGFARNVGIESISGIFKMCASWICCPYCGSPLGIERLGPVGVKGKPDSNLFKCECCGSTFRVKGGESFPEGLRSKGL